MSRSIQTTFESCTLKENTQPAQPESLALIDEFTKGVYDFFCTRRVRESDCAEQRMSVL